MKNIRFRRKGRTPDRWTPKASCGSRREVHVIIMNRKGVSPLIATVLLIAFTLAIAGIMATWAQSYVRGQTSAISSQTECIGALDAEVKNFDSTTGSIGIIIMNRKTTINLTSVSLRVDYSSYPYNGTSGPLSNFGGANNIGPMGSTGVNIVTGDSRCPDTISINSISCSNYQKELRRSAREIPC